ncbi:FAD:protein FMN transferase [Sphingomonas montana]|uniref:FAD:protein FMN transferase n=1 Tax=Sphingomonas montana TaxID=1843236 RepID=UPI001F0A391D|nr:FAD:protein FMN transferase [Sphingomonas montana]
MRIALPLLIVPDAFDRRDSAIPVVTLTGATMGTGWRILFACPRTTDPAAVEEKIVARLAGLVAEMSHWDPSSLLCRFNAAPAGRWLALPPDFAGVMATGLTIAAASGGAFDPAMGRLVDLWGYGPPGPTPPPTPDLIAAALAVSTWKHLQFDPGSRRLRQPGGLALDLSGIAKGHAADAVADLLAGLGLRDCLIEVGGELVGRGIRPDGEPWWVDLEIPPGTAAAPLRVALHGLAVATSGDYVRGPHTLDPRTGRPVANAVVSVSVLHPRAAAADAFATALTVLGAEAGIAFAREQGLAARIVTFNEGGTTEYLSPALAAMLDDGVGI